MKNSLAILMLHGLLVSAAAWAEGPVQVAATTTVGSPNRIVRDNEQEKARAAFEAGRYREAAMRYGRLHHHNPDDKETQLRLAESYQFRGKLEKAEAHAAEILARDPNHTGALLLMGQLSADREQWPAARDYYRRAVNVDAGNATAQLGLGNALANLGDEEGARAAFARYRRLAETAQPQSRR